MSSSDQDSLDAFIDQLLENPDDSSVQRLIEEHLSGLDELEDEDTPEFDDGTWQNCIGEQICRPASILEAKTLDDLKATVKTAKSNNQRVKAVGSGHSFSNVCPTDGILIKPQAINQILNVDATVLKNPSDAANLFSVESGITIKNLNNALDERRLALENMGAYDGQTLAGAISTGTHGTGLKLGPLANSVRSLQLLTSSGDILQIEPSNGITDPAKFNKEGVQLKQDDSMFNTVLVAMGCTGLIYSYTLYVVKAYYLREIRTLHTWEELKSGLQDGAASKVLTDNRGYEIDLNPYTVKGKHSCIQVLHQDDPATRRSGGRGIKSLIANLISRSKDFQERFVKKINRDPSQAPKFVNTALLALVTPDKKRGYVDKSYVVMNIGPGINRVKAFALELSVPCDTNLVATVDKLIALLERLGKERSWYMVGPIGMRFVQQPAAFLAPQANRISCMLELDMLVGINNGKELFAEIKSNMCGPGSGVRCHWGLNLDFITPEDVKDQYPDFPKWLDVYQELNKDGMWNSPFTDKIGISVGEKE